MIRPMIFLIAFASVSFTQEGQPAEPDKNLARLIGTFNGKGTMMGKEMTSKSRSYWVLEKKFLKIEFDLRATDGTMTYQARGFWRALGGDRYSLIWLDTMGKASTHEVMGAAGGFVMSYTEKTGDAVNLKKIEIIWTEKGYVEIFSDKEGEGWKKTGEMKYEKVSSLMDPTGFDMNMRAPDTFTAIFDTSKGAFELEVTRAWSPKGVDRFYNLVRNGYYDECRFFRVVPDFVAQFGIHGNPEISATWREAKIGDDPVKQSNTRGTICFATAGPNTRTVQLFINLKDNERLDKMGFSAFGKVSKGMEVVDKIYQGYGQTIPQGRIQTEGNEYLNQEFPDLDYINTARIKD